MADPILIEPKGDQVDEEGQQLEMNFGVRYRDVRFKETDKAVVNLLKALATLGIEDYMVAHVMRYLSVGNDRIKEHQKDPNE